MASPVLESFCCFFRRNYNNFTATVDKHEEYGINKEVNLTYNIFCTIFSTLGVCGAVYQLCPRKPQVPLRTHRESHLFVRQNYIITWLTVADMLAALGILVRSVLWLSNTIRIQATSIHNSTVDDDDNFAHTFCAANAGWLQYFYICTYMWTFCYALDVYLYVSLSKSLRVLYHVLGWIVSLMLATGGLVTLYYPSLLECERDTGHLLPHYLSTYLPILFVMTLNPVLFYLSTKKVRESLQCLGTYTDQERDTVHKVQKKFCLVTVAFYICWLPNILNGILLAFSTHITSRIVFHTLWIIMAITNPLQAVFNAILYKNVGGAYCYTSRHLVSPVYTTTRDLTDSIDYNSLNENSSLLSFNRLDS